MQYAAQFTKRSLWYKKYYRCKGFGVIIQGNFAILHTSNTLVNRLYMSLLLHIVGERFAVAKKYYDFSHPCPYCKNIETEITVYRQYIHICFIPVAPDNNRKSKITCTRCGKNTELPGLQREYERKTLPPLYFFSGLILFFICAVLTFIYVLPADTAREKKMLNHPQAGDLYTIKEEKNFFESGYTFLRISRVRGDTVFMLQNRYEYSQQVYSLNREDYFDTADEHAFSKLQLMEMYKDSKIYDISRDYDESFRKLK